jgi:hypothetical protein
MAYRKQDPDERIKRRMGLTSQMNYRRWLAEHVPQAPAPRSPMTHEEDVAYRQWLAEQMVVLADAIEEAASVPATTPVPPLAIPVGMPPSSARALPTRRLYDEAVVRNSRAPDYDDATDEVDVVDETEEAAEDVPKPPGRNMRRFES